MPEYGGLILENGVHPDDPQERAEVQRMMEAARRGDALYGDPDDDEEEEAEEDESVEGRG